MRPHRLRVTAFGAFGGNAEICFDDLAAAGLFLLHGETGAGKTTLLDAIGFALYGRVPGERGKARRLRSDHAAPGLATEVQLEVTIGGRLLRITRKPEQTRPKLRGDGFTTEQARILLEEAVLPADPGSGGLWETLSTRAGEADLEIADLMGMSAEQFYQVVLLPQGQFAQFLQAGAEERAKLLQRLFGTDRFRAVEDWLAERRRTCAHEVAAAQQDIGQLIARVAEVAGVPMPELTEGCPEDSSWAAVLTEAAATASATAAGRVAECRIALEAARQRQREAERLAERRTRRAAALRKRDELAAAEPAIRATRTELDAASRAASVAPALAAAAEAARVLVRSRAAEDDARRTVRDADGGRAAAASSAELRAAGQQRLERIGQLEALRSLAEQVAAEEALAATARKTATALDAESAAGRTTAGERRRRRDELLAERDAAGAAAAGLPAARAEADRHRRAAEDIAALTASRAEAERSRHEHLTAREHAVDLREEAARLREARIDGMRAELAATLTDGAPCPVCGSLDHPELCELRGALVTREQEQEASDAADAASGVAEAVGKRVAAAETRIADLAARLAEAGFPGWAAADLTDLRAQARRLDAAARELDAAASGLATAAATLTSRQGMLESLSQEIADAETRIAELTQRHAAELDKAAAAATRAAAHRETLHAQLGDQPDLDAALAALRAVADGLIAAADAADATARAMEAETAARTGAYQAALDAGFMDTDQAAAAQRDTAWRTAADQAIREHEAAAASVAELLAAAEFAVPFDAVQFDTEEDVAGAAAAAAEAGQHHDEAVAAHARAERIAAQLAALAPGLTARIDALRPLTERAAQTRRLADLAAGQGANTLRMTLSSFVLAARLEEVAAAASERLLRMTAGRYSLAHTDSRRGGGRSGLGLLACDAWTGVDRDTSTLSGGETFMASLALALGLADVVTQEAGGTRIEALFVDEGFGSLDEDTLDEVMNVLDGLREGGRCVGIVSHVTELRQRIPAQVRVRKAHTGSTITVTADTLAG